MGLAWLDQFIAACTGCTIDAVSLSVTASISPSCLKLLFLRSLFIFTTRRLTSLTSNPISRVVRENLKNSESDELTVAVVSQRYGKPVWVTEFAGSGTTDQQTSFITTMTSWLDSQSFIERYAYFADIEGNLVSGGQLTATGQAYNS
jgi:hypothetical protein